VLPGSELDPTGIVQMKLKNKVALVLGAVKGIGQGIGLDLAGRGCRVALTYTDMPPPTAEFPC